MFGLVVSAASLRHSRSAWCLSRRGLAGRASTSPGVDEISPPQHTETTDHLPPGGQAAASEQISANVIKSRAANEQQHAASNVSLDDLELHLLAGQRTTNARKLRFNLTWLRDSCHCAACTHRFSRQRLFTPKHFARNKFRVDRLQVANENNSKELRVRWADGHQSCYSLDWLARLGALSSVGADQGQLDKLASLRQAACFPLPADDLYASGGGGSSSCSVHWTAEQLRAQLRPIDYANLTDGVNFSLFDEPTYINATKPGAMSKRRLAASRTLTQQLVTLGLAKIENVPQTAGRVLSVARALAYERPTGYGTVFDVLVEPSDDINLAYSAQEFDLHSDLTYRETSPGVQLLHCIRSSSSGGLSYFSDAFQAAQQLRSQDERLFGVLINFPAVFAVRDPYREVKFRRQQPIITLNYRNQLEHIYYSPYMLPPIGHCDDVKLFYLALDKFTQLLHSDENKLITKMHPGDLFIFHNRRVLHGRSAYDAADTERRFLQGCYMDWDEIECLHEKLHSSLPAARPLAT